MQHTHCHVGEGAKVAGAAAEDAEEELIVTGVCRVTRHRSLHTVGHHNVKGRNVVGHGPERACEHTPPASLSVTTNVDVGALAMGEEEAEWPELLVHGRKRQADADRDGAGVLVVSEGGVGVLLGVVDVLESLPRHVDLDVQAVGRRAAAVRVAAGPHGDGDFLLLRVRDGLLDVLVASRVQNGVGCRSPSRERGRCILVGVGVVLALVLRVAEKDFALELGEALVLAVRAAANAC